MISEYCKDIIEIILSELSSVEMRLEFSELLAELKSRFGISSPSEYMARAFIYSDKLIAVKCNVYNVMDLYNYAMTTKLSEEIGSPDSKTLSYLHRLDDTVRIATPYNMYKMIDAMAEDSDDAEYAYDQANIVTFVPTEEDRNKLHMPVENISNSSDSESIYATSIFVLESQILYIYRDDKWCAVAKYNKDYINYDDSSMPIIFKKDNSYQDIKDKLSGVTMPFSMTESTLITSTIPSGSEYYYDYIKSYSNSNHRSGNQFTYNDSTHNGDIILTNVNGDIFNSDEVRLLTMNDVFILDYNSTDLFDESTDANRLIRYSYVSSMIKDFQSKIDSLTTRIDALESKLNALSSTSTT